jgi:hypothetical protein
MATTSINWAAAFTSYVGGSTLEEIGAVFGIPETTLKARSVSEKWKVMKEKILTQSRALVTTDTGPMSQLEANNSLLPPEVRARLALIKQNREVQYQRAVKMGEELDRILQGIRAGTYRVGKYMSVPKSSPVWVEAAPGPADLVNIATYARTLADLAYRALGDAAADGQERRAEVSATNSPQQAITIILPTAIGAPRGERILPPGDGPVIDLRPEPPGSPQSQPEPPEGLPGGPGTPTE